MNLYLACVFQAQNACGGNVVLLRTFDTKRAAFDFGRIYKGKMLRSTFVKNVMQVMMYRQGNGHKNLC